MGEMHSWTRDMDFKENIREKDRCSRSVDMEENGEYKIKWEKTKCWSNKKNRVRPGGEIRANN